MKKLIQEPSIIFGLVFSVIGIGLVVTGYYEFGSSIGFFALSKDVFLHVL